MKHAMYSVLVAGLIFAAPMARADAIKRACLQSDRTAANPPLCTCIQSAADRTLSSRDQRTGAKFFDDPHAAQEMRQSDRRSHEAFWERWRNFGEAAEALCS